MPNNKVKEQYLYSLDSDYGLSFFSCLWILLLTPPHPQPSARGFPERSDVLACHQWLGHGRYILLKQSNAGNKQSPSLVSESILPCSIRCRKEMSPLLYIVRGTSKLDGHPYHNQSHIRLERHSLIVVLRAPSRSSLTCHRHPGLEFFFFFLLISIRKHYF